MAGQLAFRRRPVPPWTFSTAPRPKRRDRYGELPGMLWVILLFEGGVHRRPLCAARVGAQLDVALQLHCRLFLV